MQALRIVANAEANPAPYPPDIRAKGWRFQLDYERLEQSDTWALASPEMRPWLLMLWLTAWRQAPCGALPSDDELIAARIGMAPRQFAAHRDILMRGWRLHDDGRLYHPTITEQVLEMMGKRQKDAGRAAAWRAQKNQALGSDVTRDSRGVTRDSTVSTAPEPEPENSRKTTSSSSAGPTPHAEVYALYAEVLPELPQVRVTGKTRDAAIRRFWAWVMASKRPDGTRRAETREEGLAWVRSYFEMVRESDFLMGRSARTEAHRNWRPDIDYLVSERGIRMVVEKVAS